MAEATQTQLERNLGENSPMTQPQVSGGVLSASRGSFHKAWKLVTVPRVLKYVQGKQSRVSDIMIIKDSLKELYNALLNFIKSATMVYEYLAFSGNLEGESPALERKTVRTKAS